MRGMPYRERLLVANLMRLLGASTVATLGVVLVLVYEGNQERMTFLPSKRGFLHK